MSGLAAIAALGPMAGTAAGTALAAPATGQAAAQAGTPPAGGFGALLAQGIGSVDAKVARADELVARFAVDDTVPVHQVTIALEEARLSVEFAMQVRGRLVEGYKELMNMQL